MRRVLAVATGVILLGALLVGGLAVLEDRRVDAVEELDRRFVPAPGYTDTRRAALDTAAPDALAMIDANDVLIDRATSALYRVTDSGATRCPGMHPLLPWTKERLRLHCESASEYVLDWAHRTVWADLYDAVLTRCVEADGSAGPTPEHTDFQGYRRTDPGFAVAAYDAHAARLADLREAAVTTATPAVCTEMLAALSAG